MTPKKMPEGKIRERMIQKKRGEQTKTRVGNSIALVQRAQVKNNDGNIF